MTEDKKKVLPTLNARGQKTSEVWPNMILVFMAITEKILPHTKEIIIHTVLTSFYALKNEFLSMK